MRYHAAGVSTFYIVARIGEGLKHRASEGLGLRLRVPGLGILCVAF